MSEELYEYNKFGIKGNLYLMFLKEPTYYHGSYYPKFAERSFEDKRNRVTTALLVHRPMPIAHNVATKLL